MEIGLTEFALLPYQQRWLEDPAPVKLYLKSRRIGATWASAADDVLNAADGTTDAVYLSSSQDLAVEYMLAVRFWCERLGLMETGEFHAVDKDGLRVQSTTFRSGKRIIAAPSTPGALRGRQATVTIDECCIVPCFTEVLRAALPMLIWGSRIRMIATAGTVDNPYMRLVEDVRSGKHENYSLHVTDFDAALQDGLYRRICLVKGEKWTPEGEQAWRAGIIREHGIFADSELFCRPVENLGAGWFSRSRLKVIQSLRDISFRPPEVRRAIRFWDLAASPVSATYPDPDWTVGARVLELSDGNFLIDDVVRLREGPATVEAEMVHVAGADGRQVEVGTWQDPGAAGKSDAAAKGRALTGCVFHAPKAAKNKVDFAKGWASLAEQGRIYVLDRHWTEDFLREAERFPGGAHDDQIDAVSGAFEVLIHQGAYAGVWSRAWARD